jgi:hypothetical protein
MTFLPITFDGKGGRAEIARPDGLIIQVIVRRARRR